MDVKCMVRTAVEKLYHNRLEGDLLMDAPASTCWEELVAKAKDEKKWRQEVRKIKDMICIEAGKGGKAKKQEIKKAGAAAVANKGNKTKRNDKDEEESEDERGKNDEDDDDGWGGGWRRFKKKRVHQMFRNRIKCNDGFTM